LCVKTKPAVESDPPWDLNEKVMDWITARREITDGTPVRIDCPKCHAAGVPGTPRYFEEPVLLLYLIPLFTFRNVFVTCAACGQSLASSAATLDELYRLPPEELSKSLQPYVSGVGRAMVILALALFWFPFLAPFLAIGGFFMTRRHRRWRRMAIVSLILSFTVAALFIALMVVVPLLNKP
jgi:hypothetical protein